MKTPRTRIASLIAERTLRAGVSKRFSKEVAAYLLQERRVNELDSVLRDVQAGWAAAGHVEVLASSAHPLTAAIRADIRRRVQRLYPAARQIIITPVADPGMIGGVRLAFAGRQLDLSIRSKLDRFKQLAAKGKD